MQKKISCWRYINSRGHDAYQNLPQNVDDDQNVNQSEEENDDANNEEIANQNAIQIEWIICKDSIYLRNERDYAVLPCGHMFHYECIDDWIGNRRKNSCPIDRTRVLRNQIIKIRT